MKESGAVSASGVEWGVTNKALLGVVWWQQELEWSLWIPQGADKGFWCRSGVQVGHYMNILWDAGDAPSQDRVY